MFTTMRYVWLTAKRDRLFLSVFAALFAVFGLSAFLGNIALVEESQLSLVYAASGARAALVVGFIIFICFHVRRAFENHEIEYMLTRPVTRTGFVVAYWFGFALLALLMCLLLGLIIWFLFPNVAMDGLAIWTLMLFLELCLVAAFAVFAALIINSAASAVMLCFGFYLIGRMIGFFLYILESPGVVYDSGLEGYLGLALKGLSAILPRLDLFTHSEWLVYGVSGTVIWLPVIQAAIFVPLLLSVAIIDFKRRNF